jgi:predicted metal-dependent phosphoesterase TrpH
VLRADLHVHSWHSGYNHDLPFLKSRDCFADPLAVYQAAKARGMDLVAITDHDSIDGALELVAGIDNPADVIIGEEVSCWYRNIEVHLGVYGMTEALHRDIQPLRGNAFEVIACLRSAGVFFSLNHLLHFYRWQTPLIDYLRLVEEVPALEARNGAMLRAHNLLIDAIVMRRTAGNGTLVSAIGGSDAHTLRRVGRTWTEAPGTTATAFLASLSAGLGKPGGDHGGPMTIAADTYGVVARYAASVYGRGPRDHSGWHRAGCALFVAGSIPAQFMPMVVALVVKSRERRAVASAVQHLASRPLRSASWAEPAAEPQA